MNKLEEYMNLPFTLMLIPDLEEGGFTAYFPELNGCITCGETYAEAVDNAMDAKKEWLMACIEDGIEIPKPHEQAVSWL
jgi:predicted RNase H-like HicB family nuclease